jgi:hypothetical protein
MSAPAPTQPVPWEFFDGPQGMRVASDGTLRLCVLEPEGKMFRRRAIVGVPMRCMGDALLPKLNEFAGDILKQPDMPATEAVARLLALAGSIPTAEPTRRECVVAELSGVRVYIEGRDVVLTMRDLQLAGGG